MLRSLSTNSLGFMDYFQFQKRNERSVNITRDSFLKESNDYSSAIFTTNRGDRGYTTYSQVLDEQWAANTRFLYDYEATFLQNLFMSPDVRVRFGDETVWYPVQILTNSYVEKTNRKDRLFQYEVQFKMAHNIKSQRG